MESQNSLNTTTSRNVQIDLQDSSSNNETTPYAKRRSMVSATDDSDSMIYLKKNKSIEQFISSNRKSE